MSRGNHGNEVLPRACHGDLADGGMADGGMAVGELGYSEL
jgi:hypothetical protein